MIFEKSNSKFFPIFIIISAGESLGALGTEECLKILERFKDDPVVEVSETCTLAVDRIKWVLENQKGDLISKYHTYDPAPSSEVKDISKLEEILLNDQLSMFERYRALFSLRDIVKDDSHNEERVKSSISAICKGLKDKSALFRHEMAYVLGQISHPYAIESLKETLELSNEHEMVRHESAEALGKLNLLFFAFFLNYLLFTLGNIATEETYPVLFQFSKDNVDVVRESCEVALDVYDYVNNNDQFQYCDSLISVQSENTEEKK